MKVYHKVKDEKVSALVVLKAVKKEAAPIIEKISSLQINSQPKFEKAGMLVKQLKEFKAIAENKESKIIDPILQGVELIRDLFKPFKQEIDQIEAEVKKQMVEWLEEVERKKQELNEAIEEGEIEPEDMPAPSNFYTGSSYSKTREVSDIKVDTERVPRKYLIPNMKLIRADLKKKKRIPGVTVKKKKNIAI